MADDFAANYPPLVSREQAGNGIGRAIAMFAGRGRRYSVKELANATGVKDRMIECAKLAPGNIDYRPLPDWALLSIARFLGPAFTNVWLAEAGQVAIDGAELDYDDLAAAAANFQAEYARARHKDSPGGVAIVAEEEPGLDAAIPIRGRA